MQKRERQNQNADGYVDVLGKDDAGENIRQTARVIGNGAGDYKNTCRKMEMGGETR